MKKEENDIFSCDLSGFVRLNFIIVLLFLFIFFRFFFEDSFIIFEIQVFYEEIIILGIDLKFFYLSFRVVGYKLVFKIIMIQFIILFNLMKVYFMVVVVGRFF